MVKEGFIEYKEAKKGVPPAITKINRANKELNDWMPTISSVA